MNKYFAETGLFYHSPKEGKKRSLVSWCLPYSFLDKQSLGHYFGIVEIYQSNNFWANAEVLKIINKLTDKFNNYFRPDFTPEKNLENLLNQLNTELENLIEEKSLPLESEKINVLIGIIEDNILSFTQVGGISAYLIHHLKKNENVIINILEKTPGASNRPYPLKMFTNVITGKISTADYLFFCNDNVLNYLSLNKIQQIINSHPVAETTNQFKELLSDVSVKTDFATLLIKPTPATENASLPINRQPINVFLPPDAIASNISSQQSMERLLSTQAYTSSILSPSLKPELQKINQLIKKTLGGVWQNLATNQQRYQKLIKNYWQDKYQQQKQNLQTRKASLQTRWAEALPKISPTAPTEPELVNQNLEPELVEKLESFEELSQVIETTAELTVTENLNAEPELPIIKIHEEIISEELVVAAAPEITPEPIFNKPVESRQIIKTWLTNIKAKATFVNSEKLVKLSANLNQLALTGLINLGQILKTGGQTFWRFSKKYFGWLAQIIINYWRRQPKILERLNQLLNWLNDKLSNLEPASKKILYYFLVVLFLLLQSLTWQGQYRAYLVQKQSFTKQINTSQALLADAEAKLIIKDETSAKQTLAETKTNLDQLAAKNLDQKNQLTELKQALTLLQAKLEKKLLINQPELVFALNYPETLNAFTKVGDYIYTVNPTDKSLYLLNLATKQNEKLITNDNLIGIKNLKPLSDKLLYLQTDRALIEYDTQKNILTNLNLDPKPTANIANFEFFNQKLYLLIPPNNQLIKYSQVAGGFGNGLAAWRGKDSLTDTVALAIDNSLYALKNTGEIIKSTNGKSSLLLKNNLTPPLTSGQQLLTNTDWSWLYLLDNQNNRLLVLEKDGTLKMQYIFNNLPPIQDVVISPADQQIYLLAGNKLYKITSLE